MSEESTKEKMVIKLDPIQFKDLVITIDYLREELKRGADKLVAIEGELRLLRIEIMDKKGKFDDKIKK